MRDAGRSSSSATATSARLRVSWSRLLEPCKAARPIWRSRPSPRVSAEDSVSPRLRALGDPRRCGLRDARADLGSAGVARQALDDVLPFARGFGMEIGMTIDAVRTGHRIGRGRARPRPPRQRAHARRLPPSRTPAGRFRARVRCPAVISPVGCAGQVRQVKWTHPPRVACDRGARPMILAIDQGTTGTTCLVFDERAEPIGRALPRVHPALPAARLGRARRARDLGGHAGRRRRGARRCRRATPAICEAARHHQPARDGLRVGPGLAASRCTTRSSGRTAARRRAASSCASRARAARARAHRADARPLLLGDEDRSGCSSTSTGLRERARHGARCSARSTRG